MSRVLAGGFSTAEPPGKLDLWLLYTYKLLWEYSYINFQIYLTVKFILSNLFLLLNFWSPVFRRSQIARIHCESLWYLWRTASCLPRMISEKEKLLSAVQVIESDGSPVCLIYNDYVANSGSLSEVQFHSLREKNQLIPNSFYF